MAGFPFYRQINIMDCGPTCLQIISKYYGHHLPIAFLRKITNTGKEGSSLLGISKGAEQIGFRTLGIKARFDTLRKEAPLPLVAHWNQGHFVVVYKITKKHVFVSDPAEGLLEYSHREFVQNWIDINADTEDSEGIVMLFEPTRSFYNNPATGVEDSNNATSFFLHYVRPYRKLMIQVLLSLAVGSILQLSIPFLTQNIVDTGIYKKDISFIWLVLIAQLMIIMGQISLELIRSWTILHISSRINISLISDFFIKLMKLPISYFDTRLSGDLLQRINDHERIESFLTHSFIGAIFSVFSLLLYSGVLAYYDFSLFGIFLFGSLLYIGWILFFLKQREKLDYKHFQQAGATNTKVLELVNGMQEIKLHNAEQQKRWGWERIQVKLYHISLKTLTLEQTQNIGSRLINEIKNIFVTIVAAKLVIDGNLTLGMMLSVSYIIGQLNGPLLGLVGVVKSWQDARISLNRLTEIHQKEDEQSVTLYEPVKELSAERTFYIRNVSFRYSDLSDAVLKDINLIIPAKKITAIVGSSGSGKTTLLKVLMRFYEPDSGVIRIGNTNLSEIDIRQWRNICGVVMQEGFIFNDTIAGNIAVGEEIPDWERLYYAIDIARIKSFIDSLPLGLNTKIGYEGHSMSTGQKQRILIARAVYKNPEIIFLDEATSSLDANNEREIINNLKEFYHGKTVIVIAHRLSTVRDADNIVVLENGTIVEEGTHDELIGSHGYYYRLVKNQLELG